MGLNHQLQSVFVLCQLPRQLIPLLLSLVNLTLSCHLPLEMPSCLGHPHVGPSHLLLSPNELWEMPRACISLLWSWDLLLPWRSLANSFSNFQRTPMVSLLLSHLYCVCCLEHAFRCNFILAICCSFAKCSSISPAATLIYPWALDICCRLCLLPRQRSPLVWGPCGRLRFCTDFI